MLRIEKKTENPHALRQRIIWILIAFAIAGVVIAICGYNPLTVYLEMLKGSFSSRYNFTQTIEKMIPLLVMGLGVAICFKMKFINIGAEGQFCMGAIGATYIALFTSFPIPVKLILMFVFAFFAGGVWCLIAGLLKSKWRVSETLVTLMLNYVALKLVSYLQYVAWKDPNSYGFPKIANFPSELQFPELFGVNCGWIVALVVTVLVYFLLEKTKFGFELSVMGDTPATARYIGINTKRTLFLATLIGGGICGLAGLIQVSGVEHTLNVSMSAGMGYTAIVIAYMAKMRPGAIAIVSLLFSILLQGGAYMQISMQIPAAASEVIQGVILLVVLGSEFFANYRIVRVSKEVQA